MIQSSENRYQSPLIQRYASPEMAEIFAPIRRARIWRELWLALAEAESELGMEISGEALSAMRSQHQRDLFVERIAKSTEYVEK